MRQTYLLIDVSALAHRALHTVGDLVHPDNPEQYTGVLYQLHQTARRLAEDFNTQNLCFFFDSRRSLRKETYANYKGQRELDRAKENPVMKARRQGMHDQVRSLPKLLREMGVVNIYGQMGYEADDLIASAALNNLEHELIIVGRDQDLFQVLGPHVSMYDVKKRVFYTESDFRRDWNLSPCQWASVKAWAGCTSDSIEGVAKVGEKTAAKYIRGQIPSDNSKYPLFANNIDVYNRNINLVKLPYGGTDRIILSPQGERIRWSLLIDLIGATSDDWLADLNIGEM
jgi:DNA polymerase I